MTPHLPEEPLARIAWRAFTIVGSAMPPRDPDDEDEEEDEDESADEMPVVREPDED